MDIFVDDEHLKRYMEWLGDSSKGMWSWKAKTKNLVTAFAI
jgi:hypothetical protein